MNLLQIKPLEEPKVAKKAIGIDLGTTHSIVALFENDKVKYFQENQNDLIPSVVHYDKDGSVLVGAKAQERLMASPSETLYSIKRLMGRSIQELEKQNIHFPYQFHNAEQSQPHIQIHEKTVTPVQVSAEILRSLLHLSHSEDASIDQAVITVPAYFDETQRQATLEAARLAGIQVLRLLNEPTAAAIAYGLEQKAEGLYLVYDLGGGTFDVSLLKIEKGVFEVLGMGGLSHLGGDDFDRLIAEHLRDKVGAKVDIASLRVIAKNVKETLSTKAEVLVNIENQSIRITRAEFEDWIFPLVMNTLETVNEVLKTANVLPAQIDGVLLVGGSTRVPYIIQLMEKHFSGKLHHSIDPDKVVAMGAAIQASILSGNRKDPHVLLDVIPLSLGIEMMGGLVEKILMRNSKMPCQRTQTFTTYQDNQTGLSLHVVQGERELAKDCRSLAQFDLTGIPPMPAGLARIEVSFRLDADGLLDVTAIELQSQTKSHIQVKPTFALSSDTIGELLNDSIANASQDVKNRKISEKCVEAQHLIDTVEKAMQSSSELLTGLEIQNIQDAKEALSKEIENKNSVAKLNTHIQALESAADVLMQKRLQWVLDQTLTGRSISEVFKDYD